MIIRESSVTERSLVTRCRLLNAVRSDNNPHGFIMEGFEITENKDLTCKVSVRTTKEIDASAICARCGGGGHLRAAGATLSCEADEACARILEATEQVYAESELV